ncbi:PA domain-containing protein [Brumimicrobium salinarum]
MYSIPCSDLESMAISNPQSTADIVRNALYDGVDQNNHLIARTISGGRINAKNSLDLLMADVCNSCSIPSNITTNVINENDAHITFDIEPITDSVKLSIQVAGSGNWNEYMITGNSFTIPSLLSCTNYEYYLTAYCQNEISTQSITKAFTTSGCGNCIDLNYCNALAVNPATSLLLTKPASISGNYAFTPTSNFGGDIENGYNYGELILVDDGTANSNEGCAPLINALDINGNIAVVYRGSCNFTDKVLNAQNAGALAVIVINNVSTAPIEMGGTNNSIIIPAVMISQSDGTILMNAINNGDNPEVILGKQSEWNESFEINGQQFTTGNNNGYYFNDFTIQLSRNTTNSFTLTPGFEGQPLEVYYKIWLDENQDGVFDNTEIIYDQVTPATSSITDLFTVPPTAQLGKTRMRIQMSFQGYNTLDLPDVCGSFNSGEIEDYCVNITSGNICGMSVTSSVNNPTCQGVNDGSIALNVTGVNGPYTYTWNNGSTTANINNLSADNLFVNISDQNTCDTTIYFELNFEKELTLSETIVPPSCPNLADGSIDVHASGSSNFTYQWVNGPSNNLWNNIGMGTYDIIVTDFEGCSITKNYSLQNSQNPNPTLIADFDHDNQDLNVNFINNSINGSSYIWNFGDGNSSTQINPSHTYPQEGTYEVCLKVQSSCDTVNLCKAIEVFEQEAALSNNSKNTTIKIYPNPASEQIIINKGASQAEKAFIYNTIGALIEVYDLRDVNTSLDLNQLNSGIYFIQIRNNKGDSILIDKIRINHQ